MCLHDRRSECCAAGFCGETEEEHLDTLDLIRKTQYDQAFMFAYSEREKTHAARHLEDDVPAEVKSRRLQEIIAAFRDGQLKQFQAEVGRTHLVRSGPPLARNTLIFLVGLCFNCIQTGAEVCLCGRCTKTTKA